MKTIAGSFEVVFCNFKIRVIEIIKCGVYLKGIYGRIIPLPV